MIYLFIFMYLLICVILYDVYERKLHLRANYIVLYFLFTLIAGLRWRLGVDTVNYMNFFNMKCLHYLNYLLNTSQSPDISHSGSC